MTISAVLLLKFEFPAFAATCRGDLCSLGSQLPSERRKSQRSLCSEAMLVLAAWLGSVRGERGEEREGHRERRRAGISYGSWEAVEGADRAA